MTASIRALTPGLLAGLGAWCTAARLELAPAADGAIRVAMFPAVWLLVVSTVAGAAIVLLLGEALPWLARRIGHRRISRETARSALWPLAASSLVAIPYLPWLADQLPVLTVLAGSGRWLVWGIAVAETVWAVAVRWHRADRAPIPVEPVAAIPSRASRARLLIAIFLLGLLATGSAAAKLTGTVLYPGGDEPHYLIIAQSLWRDGDLRIENNHERRDYAEYFHGRELAPHTLSRGLDGEIYSVHPVGLPVLLAPIYAFAGYRGAAAAVLLIGCTAAALMTGWVARVTGNVGAATFSWAALLLGAPLLYNAFAIYPEVPAALAVTLAFTLSWPGLSRPTGALEPATTVPALRGPALRGPAARGPAPSGPAPSRPAMNGPVMSGGRALACGLAIAALPWLSTKYALMAGALGLVVLGRLWFPAGRSPAVSVRRLWGQAVPTAALVLPCFISLVAWLFFFALIWGSWSPTAPYGTQRETRLAYLPSGGPGLLFDQEYGVVAFAPVLFLGLTGLVSMIRRGGHFRRLGLEIALVFTALLGVVGAFHLWWGGTAIVGRPIVSGLWLLALPIAWQQASAAAQPVRRAAHRLLLWLGAAISVTLGVAQQGLLLNAGRDGTSQLLDYLSPAWPLTSLFPTFIASSAARGLTKTICWVAAALAVGWILKRAHRLPVFAARPRLAAIAAMGSALVLLSLLVPLVTSRSGRSMAATIGARTQVSLLDDFDSTARPWAVRYDPMRFIDPRDVPSLFTLTAHPTPGRSPERGLFGARLSLPAGRYRVDLRSRAPSGSVVNGEIGLRVGRLGRSVVRWPVDLAPGERWHAEFELPIDVGYVGFVATPALERLSPAVRVTPLAIVNLHDRRPRLDVASAHLYGSAQVLAHDHRAWLESTGLWVQGRASVPLTVWRPGSRRARLVMNAPLVPMTVTAVTATTRERHSLRLGGSADVWVPLDMRGVGHVVITSSDGVTPAAIAPGNGDKRYLGCWIEIGDKVAQTFSGRP